MSQDTDPDFINNGGSFRSAYVGDMASHPYPTPPSDMKLLWRTAFRSPIVKWILPLKHPNKIQVAFVGDFFVEVKEWNVDTETLRTLAITSDFPACTVSAEVLGLQRVSRTFANGDAVNGHASNGYSAMDLDEDAHEHKPPSVLIVVLENATMVLLTVQEENGSVAFDVHAQPLLAGSPLGQVGRHLTTDPLSRAIAVGASDDQLTIYSLAANGQHRECPSNMICASLTMATSLSIICTCFLLPPPSDTDKVILVAYGTSGCHIYCVAYLWEWRTSLRPENVRSFVRKLPPEHGTPNLLIPLQTPACFMLACDRTLAVYHLGSDGNLEQTDTTLLYEPGTNDDTFRPESAGASLGPPLWTNWARPTRRPSWTHEVFYLGREDGVLKYVQLKTDKSSKQRIDKTSDAGTLDSNIGSAFTVLDIPQLRLVDGAVPDDRDTGIYGSGYPDAFIYVGELSDGGLVEIGLKNGVEDQQSPADTLLFSRAQAHEPQVRDRFTNWAPVSAAVVVAKSQTSSNGAHAGFTRGCSKARMLAACGRAPYGSIAELRHGIEASTRDFVLHPDDDLDLKGLRTVWIVHLDGARPYLILSFPWKTLWCYLETLPNSSDLTGIMRNLPSCQSDNQTLTAGVLGLGRMPNERSGTLRTETSLMVVIQVTQSNVSLVSVEHADGQPTCFRTEALPPISVACLNSPSNDRVLTVSDSVDGTSVVSVNCLDIAGFQLMTPGKSCVLNCDASCATFCDVVRSPSAHPRNHTRDLSLALVGGTDGSVLVFEASVCGELNRLCILAEAAADNDRVGRGVESLRLVSSPVEDGTFTILCGRRDGQLDLYELRYRLDYGVNTSHVQSITIGEDPVRLDSGNDKSGATFLRCGSRIARLTFPEDCTHTARVESVYYTTPSEVDFRHSSLDALCYVEEEPSSPMAGRLVGVSNSNFLCGFVDPIAKPLPVRDIMPGTPDRLLYSHNWGMLVASSTINHVDENLGKRFAISTIHCMRLPPDQSEIKREDGDDESRMISFQLLPGEKALDLQELALQMRGKEHHFILIGSSLTSEMLTDSGMQLEETGSLRWLRLTTSRSGQKSLDSQKLSKENGPVHSICTLGPNGSFFYAAGRLLKRRHLNADLLSWPTMLLYEFPSPVVSMVLHENAFLFVSTSHHSTQVFGLEWSESGDLPNLTLLAAHDEPLQSLAMLPMSTARSQQRALNTSEDGLVSCLSLKSDTGSDSGSSNSFMGHANGSTTLSSTVEARLPVPVNHLLRADVRPPHKNSSKVRGVLEDDIVGTALDGSVFTFSILEEAAWRLLRFVQNMCLRDRRICSLESKQVRLRTPVEPSAERPADMSVNGDIVARLVERPDARSVLQQMIDAEPGKAWFGGRRVDFDTTEERKTRFATVVHAATGVDVHDEDTTVLTALKYLRQVLEIPF